MTWVDMLDVKDIGLDIVVVGSAISIIGVIANNIFLLHILAMQIWVFSNLLFAVFFHGRINGWWDGGLSDKVMRAMYIVMLVSGLWGLMQP